MAGGSGYDGAASSGSNLGPTNPDLLDAVSARVAYREENGLAADALVPVDAVTASGLGSRPAHLGRQRRLQAPRVAEARGLDIARSSRWSTSTPTVASFGVLGEPGVNVVELNLALDDLSRLMMAGRANRERLEPMAAAERSASTSVPRPASARPTRCWARA